MSISAVAKMAKVSTTTVSRTINGSPSVRPKTAAQVRKAIAELGFQPDINAGALGSGRSSLYGLILSDITNPFFPELVRAFEEEALKHDKEILIANTVYEPKRLEICIVRMLQRRVDGVAIMTSEMDHSVLSTFRERKIPVVLLDAHATIGGVNSVRIDHASGMREAVQHRASLNHVQIGFMSGPMHLDTARQRHTGFLDACKALNIRVAKRDIAQGDHGVRGGYRAMQALLENGGRLTAVVCSNDLTAIGAIEMIYEAGLGVPEDISVVGFDDILLSAYTRPRLTTVAVAREDLAVAAFRSLLSYKQDTDHQAIGREHVFTPALIRRQSTASVAVY